MKIKTNQPHFKAFCDDLGLPCELLIYCDSPEIENGEGPFNDDYEITPFIFIEGKLVNKIIDLTKSPKFLMMKKILG